MIQTYLLPSFLTSFSSLVELSSSCSSFTVTHMDSSWTSIQGLVSYSCSPQSTPSSLPPPSLLSPSPSLPPPLSISYHPLTSLSLLTMQPPLILSLSLLFTMVPLLLHHLWEATTQVSHYV